MACATALNDHCAMARIEFTAQLQRFTETPRLDVAAATLREALDAAFAANPRLHGYVLDEQGHVRQHVVVFVDAQRLEDRCDLNHPLQPHSRIYVLQALSGG
jgi:sulfur-carrier protein